jgi:hypothetical protein
MLYFLRGTVWWPHSGWRAVAKEHDEHGCLRARAAKQPHGHQRSSAVPNKCNIRDLDFDIFESEILITEVEKSTALYN